MVGTSHFKVLDSRVLNLCLKAAVVAGPCMYICSSYIKIDFVSIMHALSKSAQSVFVSIRLSKLQRHTVSAWSTPATADGVQDVIQYTI